MFLLSLQVHVMHFHCAKCILSNSNSIGNLYKHLLLFTVYPDIHCIVHPSAVSTYIWFIQLQNIHMMTRDIEIQPDTVIRMLHYYIIQSDIVTVEPCLKPLRFL